VVNLINNKKRLLILLTKCTNESEFVIEEIKGSAERITKGFAEAREKSGLETHRKDDRTLLRRAR
jgi:hypothetical protein